MCETMPRGRDGLPCGNRCGYQGRQALGCRRGWCDGPGQTTCSFDMQHPRLTAVGSMEKCGLPSFRYARSTTRHLLDRGRLMSQYRTVILWIIEVTGSQPHRCAGRRRISKSEIIGVGVLSYIVWYGIRDHDNPRWLCSSATGSAMYNIPKPG